MNRKLWLMLALTSMSALGGAELAQAQDPTMGYLYGFSQGQAQRFANRLPTPPYFSIYPPVYYGKRFERPYGDSPYASWPTLQPADNYRPQLKQSAGVPQWNPYCPTSGEVEVQTLSTPIAQQDVRSTGKKVVIENPFVGSDVVAN